MEGKFFRWVTWIVYSIVGILLVAVVGSAITQEPLVFTVIRSGSMYPVLERGDIVLIAKVSEADNTAEGDIIVFRTESGDLASQGWIIHRIVKGDLKNGFVTKGDANDYTDQEAGNNPLISRNWIASRVVTIDKTPVKIPLLGYLPLWLEGLQKSPFLLPGIAVILAIIVGAGELKGKKKKRNKRFDHLLLYFFSGITLAVVLAASMIATSQNISFEYEVSTDRKGVMMDSPVGVLPIGEVVHKPISDLDNKGFFPIFASITTNDRQITFSQDNATIRPGEKIQISMTVTARDVGKHKTSIWVGMFLPLLPPGVINYLTQKSYWLALAAASCVPAIPLMVWPLFDYKLRQTIKKEFRVKIRKAGRLLQRYRLV
ncbi:signal peptidase I [Phosphitispora fastidiosa]|uniref:signal peptidase I n=1 Tax=Phosphitispora fastidiosa TaxID=2837202 RepID=UPI001E46E990|nr:signal peptidase I [Phosphitispora fastidiosa]MBU7006549.1 signal peptidase I [Phosphitispora fastidiosa]